MSFNGEVKADREKKMKKGRLVNSREPMGKAHTKATLNASTADGDFMSTWGVSAASTVVCRFAKLACL